MRSLSQRDQRTLKMAGIAIGIYLLLFYGLQGWKGLEARRADYQKLVREAEVLKLEMLRYETRALLKEKLQKTLRIDPAKLSRATLVGEASAAIQKAAQSGGVQLGPVRESPGSPAARELATMQLEGFGPVPAIMALLDRLENLGWPLVVDSIQIDPDPRRPGNIKLTLRVIVLDYDQWKKEKRHA